ncbi:MAG: PEP-CTERM sorting domain-containing protein [Anaerolineae bacterium]|nr:PEP-CTERM sorting domain-containing protein [Phycisphaerae bacterium]
MLSRRVLSTSFAALLIAPCAAALAQSAGPIYTWDNSGNPTPNIEAWAKNFGANTVTLDNNVAGELTVIESGGAGQDVAITDGANRVRESSTAASGGTDLTGLSYLEFDLGHNGTGPVNVQFFVQASTGFNFVALGPDLAVQPGIATYQVPLTGLTANQAVYVRTMGFNARAHATEGNLTWTLRELRSGGQTLTSRTLANFDTGSAEGGKQGMIINFDAAAVVGGNGGQNQVGLTHNPAGSGSLQWTDAAGSNGAALSLGNGTAWGGNTFNNRTTDVSNYDTVTIRISASDALNGGGTVDVASFFQANNFAFQSVGTLPLAIDGQFHDLTFSLAGLINLNVVDQTGINLGAHANELVMNIDSIVFNVVPEPTSLIGAAALGGLGLLRRRRSA